MNSAHPQVVGDNTNNGQFPLLSCSRLPSETLVQSLGPSRVTSIIRPLAGVNNLSRFTAAGGREIIITRLEPSDCKIYRLFRQFQ